MLKPTFLLAVPRVFEKVFNGAQQRAHADGKGAIFDMAARRRHRVLAEPSRPATSPVKTRSSSTRSSTSWSTASCVTPWAAACSYCVSGGAALGERLGHFFRGIGVTILEGYGLTETTAGSTLNQPDAFKIGTVGRPLPGVAVRIADDGEILIKGGGVFRGYYDNEEATKEAITGDGWFHTGDLGSLDNEGYLSDHRAQEGDSSSPPAGKNVAPARAGGPHPRRHFLVSQAMVVGDDRSSSPRSSPSTRRRSRVGRATTARKATRLADLTDDAGAAGRGPEGDRRRQQGGVEAPSRCGVPHPARGLRGRARSCRQKQPSSVTS